jgi:hypothetical protein
MGKSLRGSSFVAGNLPVDLPVFLDLSSIACLGEKNFFPPLLRRYEPGFPGHGGPEEYP